MPDFGPRIAAIEKAVTYPLGDDFFHIDHGPDYFAFFRRMGRLAYLVAERGDEVLGMLAAVRRELPGEAGGPAWYVGDLKVADRGRGLFLARRLLRALAEQGGPSRYFGISMNPGGSGSNRVVQLITRMYPQAQVARALHFYSLDADPMRAARPILEQHRGRIAYRSMRGMKDIILATTGRPMPLLHVQHSPVAELRGAAGDHLEEQRGHVHMFCCPVDDDLDRGVRAQGLVPTASATILCADGESGARRSVFHASNLDWSFVLTSDI